jgi:hypothetical protein
MTVKDAVASTPTAQMRRVTIPPHRRAAQVRQTVLGIGVGIAGMLVVKWFGLSNGWYVAAALVGVRVASREFLLDCLKIAKEFISLKSE